MIRDHDHDLVARAVAYAFDHHGPTLDRSGKLFMLHPLRVMLSVGVEHGSIHQAAAVLHDVVEDTHATLPDIRWLFGPEVESAVDAVTRRDHAAEGETYGHFIERANAHEVGRIVKRADVLDNLGRMYGLPAEEAKGMTKRYLRALRVLDGLASTWAEAA